MPELWQAVAAVVEKIELVQNYPDRDCSNNKSKDVSALYAPNNGYAGPLLANLDPESRDLRRAHC